jgi:hypothetical protein
MFVDEVFIRNKIDKYSKMVKIVDEFEKKIAEEAKKVQPIVEAVFVEVVSGKKFSCFGWTVQIYRTPSTHTPPKPTETPDDKSETPNAVVSV